MALDIFNGCAHVTHEGVSKYASQVSAGLLSFKIFICICIQVGNRSAGHANSVTIM